MRILAIAAALLVGAVSQPSGAQAPAPPVAAAPVTTPVKAEYYYRVKWGSLGEFKELYERNHAPLLREMQKDGRILSIAMEEPFTHLAGGVRWDLRVTITYPNAEDALAGAAMMKSWEQAMGRLYKNRDRFSKEEAKRFSLLEDHWDVIVYPAM